MRRMRRESITWDARPHLPRWLPRHRRDTICFTLISIFEEFPLPLYEYECVKCKHRFERLEKLSASAIDKICPKCGAKAERQVSSAAIQFKGSGWYVTDYAHKGGSESSNDPAEKPAPAKPDGKS